MRTSLPILALSVVFACAAVAAERDPDRMGALAEPLSKKIDVQFIETPLRRVVEQLQQRTGVTFSLEREPLGSAADAAVSLEAKQVTVAEALDMVTQQVGVAWEVSGRVAVISSHHALAKRNLVTRTYDIRPLLVAVPNFRGPTFDLNAALSNTNSGGSNVRMSDASKGGGGSGYGLFGDDGDGDDVEASQANRAALIEQIINLIQDTIGDPTHWAALGGDLFSASEVRGSLVIRTTPQHHAQVDQLLRGLADDTSRVIFVDARFIEAPTEQLDAALSGETSRHVLNPAQTRQLVGQLRGDAVRSLGILRTACFNGQRVYLAAGKQDTFLSDVEPVPDTAGIDPTVSTARTGAVLDIEPTIAFDGDSLVLTFRGELVLRTSLRTTRVPAGSPATGPTLDLGGSMGGQIKLDEPEKNKPITTGHVNGSVRAAGDIDPASPGVATDVALELPHGEGVEFRSSVRVPDGGAIVVTGVSGAMASVRPGHEVILVIRTTIAR